jgi:hypothetical protein
MLLEYLCRNCRVGTGEPFVFRVLVHVSKIRCRLPLRAMPRRAAAAPVQAHLLEDKLWTRSSTPLSWFVVDVSNKV